MFGKLVELVAVRHCTTSTGDRDRQARTAGGLYRGALSSLDDARETPEHGASPTNA